MANYSFRKYRPLSLRLWHWGTALLIIGLLLTVHLRKTLLSWRTNSALIQDKLSAAGTEIPSDLARQIAVAIRDPLWDWHIYMGVILGVFFVGRLLIGIFEKPCLGSLILKSLSGLGQVPGKEKADAIHFTVVKIIYAVFYLATAFMVISGFLLTFQTELGLARETVRTLKQSHELLTWPYAIFVGAHIVGVVWTEVCRAPGLVSEMISGGERKEK